MKLIKLLRNHNTSLRGLQSLSAKTPRNSIGRSIEYRQFSSNVASSTATGSLSSIEDKSLQSTGDEVITATYENIDYSQLGYGPVDTIVGALGEVHELTGLPWWGSICAFAVGIRLQNSARMVHAKGEMAAVQDKMKGAATDMQKKQYALELREVFKKHQCNPLSSILVMLIQIPIFSIVFFGVRRLVTSYDIVKSGGPEYLFIDALNGFSDLSVPDTSMMLGPVTGIVLFATMQMSLNDQKKLQALQKDKEKIDPRTESMQGFMKFLGYAMAVGMIPSSMFLPAGVTLYISTTSATALGLNLLLKIPGVDKKLGFHPDYLPGKLADLEKAKVGLTGLPGDEEIRKLREKLIRQGKSPRISKRKIREIRENAEANQSV
eukprot:maker-scaffold_26-snap-gene-2.54-mRNA-1 protein AED:0.00 eAED:0.00 QI:22/1/1/1/0/0/2/90/377